MKGETFLFKGLEGCTLASEQELFKHDVCADANGAITSVSKCLIGSNSDKDGSFSCGCHGVLSVYAIKARMKNVISLKLNHPRPSNPKNCLFGCLQFIDQKNISDLLEISCFLWFKMWVF